MFLLIKWGKLGGRTKYPMFLLIKWCQMDGRTEYPMCGFWSADGIANVFAYVLAYVFAYNMWGFWSADGIPQVCGVKWADMG
jgi:hypothetical protein